MKIWLISLLCLFLPAILCAQKLPDDRIQLAGCHANAGWQNVAAGLDRPVQHLAALQGALHIVYLADETTYELARLEEGVWQPLAEIRLNSTVGEHINAVAVYQDELYLGGSFPAQEGIAASKGLLKWDGTALRSVGGGIKLRNGQEPWINNFAFYQDKLLLLGFFSTAGGPSAANIAGWDGEGWFSFGDDIVGQIMFATELRGELVIGGGISRIEGREMRWIASWDGAAWRRFESEPNSILSYLTAYKDQLLAWTNGGNFNDGERLEGLIVWNGARWTSVYTGDVRIVVPQRLQVIGGTLYVACAIRDSENTGPTTAALLSYDGREWRVLAVFDKHAHGGVAQLDGALYAAGHFDTICDVPIAKVAKLVDAPQHTRLSGQVYAELDGDCKRDSEDFVVPGAIVRVEPGPQFAQITPDGNFSLLLRPGAYTATATLAPMWRQECPAESELPLDVDAPGKELTGADFVFAPRELIRALDVSIAAGFPRLGSRIDYVIRYRNVGTLPFSGELRLTYDPVLSLIGSKPVADRQAESELTWQVRDLALGDGGRITLSCQIPPDETLRGREFCVHVLALPEQGQDEVPGYNGDSLCSIFRSSFDPNDISVSPAGDVTSKHRSLDYLIRFQNTGTDTAFKVVVVDTLDHRFLDIASLRLGAASHPYTFDLQGAGILSWTFDNIMLPDSNVNEAASHGFLKYRVELREDVNVGSAIDNRAAIYFDFNSPVITNTVRTNVVGEATSLPPQPDGDRPQLYPNPATATVIVDAADLQSESIRIWDIHGRMVPAGLIFGAGAFNISVAHLPAGSYVLSASGSKGPTFIPFVKLP